MMLGSIPFERKDRIKLIDEFVSLYPVIMRNMVDEYRFTNSTAQFIYCCTHNMIMTFAHNYRHPKREGCKTKLIPDIDLPRACKKSSTVNGVAFSNIQIHVDAIREQHGFETRKVTEKSLRSRGKDDTK